MIEREVEGNNFESQFKNKHEWSCGNQSPSLGNSKINSWANSWVAAKISLVTLLLVGMVQTLSYLIVKSKITTVILSQMNLQIIIKHASLAKKGVIRIEFLLLILKTHQQFLENWRIIIRTSFRNLQKHQVLLMIF